MPKKAGEIVSFATSNAPVEETSAAPEKMIGGSGAQTVQNHYSDPTGQFFAGIWTGEAGKWKVSYSEEEYCHLLEGEVVLTDLDGNSASFSAGDSFVVPAGFEGTWENLSPARKHYVIFEPKS